MEEKKVDQKNKETSYNYWTKDAPYLFSGVSIN